MTDDDGVSDVRPLGLGKCLRRAIHSAIADSYKDNWESYFWP